MFSVTGVGQNTAKAGRSQKKMIIDEMNAYNSGNLGLDKSQRSDMITDATQAAGAQAAGTQQQLRRESLANGGAFSGEYAKAQRDVGAQTGEAAAKAAQAASIESERMASERKDKLYSAVERAAEAKRARTLQYAQLTGVALKNIADYIGGGQLGNLVGELGNLGGGE
jgi:hypothetical protein